MDFVGKFLQLSAPIPSAPSLTPPIHLDHQLFLLLKCITASSRLERTMSGISHGCKTGLQFYTCKSNGFQGCCSVDPCTSSGCPVADDGNESDTDVATTKEPVSISADSKTASIGPTFISAGSNPASAMPTTFSTSTLTSAFTSTHTLQPSPAATTTPYAIATLLEPPFVGAASSTESYSTVLFTSFLYVSQVFVTPTSNGVVLPPTSSMLTSTILSSTSMLIAVPSSTTLGSASSSISSGSSSAESTITKPPPAPSHDRVDHTAAIAGSIGSVGGLVFAALLIWLLLRWQRRRQEKENRNFQLDDDPRLQGIDANRAGSAFKESDGKPRILDGFSWYLLH